MSAPRSFHDAMSVYPDLHTLYTTSSIGPVTADCPHECGNRDNLIHDMERGWVPDDLNRSTGRSPTRTQERCSVCGLWAIWRTKVGS